MIFLSEKENISLIYQNSEDDPSLYYNIYLKVGGVLYDVNFDFLMFLYRICKSYRFGKLDRRTWSVFSLNETRPPDHRLLMRCRYKQRLNKETGIRDRFVYFETDILKNDKISGRVKFYTGETTVFRLERTLKAILHHSQFTKDAYFRERSMRERRRKNRKQARKRRQKNSG